MELAWTLRHVSSQDDEAIEAVRGYDRHFIYGKAWMSAKKASSPQTIIIQLDQPLFVRQVTLLARPSYTPRSAAISTALDDGNETDLENMDFDEIGRTSFAVPTDEPFAESVDIRAIVVFIKIELDSVYRSDKNADNQVGIMAIKVTGERAPKKRDKRSKNKRNGGSGRYSNSDSDGSDTNFHARAIIQRGKQREEQARKRKSEKKKGDKKKENVPEDPKPTETKSKRRDVKPSPFDEYLKLEDKELRHPTYVDLEEYNELIMLLNNRKEECIYERRYIDAKELKAISDDLSIKRDEARVMISDLSHLIQEERYQQAQRLQEKYDEHRFSSTKDYTHIKEFLTEEEQERYVTNFGKDEENKRETKIERPPPDEEAKDPTEEEKSKVELQNKRVKGTREATSEDTHHSDIRTRTNDDDYDAEFESHNGVSTAHYDDQNTRRTYPSEDRVRKVLAMDAADDPLTGDELTDILDEMQRYDRVELDWRVQVLLRKYGKHEKSRDGKKMDASHRRDRPQSASSPQTRRGRHGGRGGGEDAKEEGKKKNNDNDEKKKESSSCAIL